MPLSHSTPFLPTLTLHPARPSTGKMRQRRAKIYRKMLQQYSLQFGFREPYQLLVDDTFALALARYKISDPLNQFGNVLQTKKVKPLITQCCMAALYALGKEHQPTVEMAKAWERRMCNHREAIAPTECIKQCIGPENKHRYIVASEQAELRRDLRLNVPALPLMHFTQAVIVLEPMSPLTRNRIDDKEEDKLNLPASEAGLLKSKPDVDVDIVGAEATEEGKEEKEGGARRRKRKAPNPLSVRKAKNPKLTMEQKLQREQELKKQKQRAAARARLQATKPEAAKLADEKSPARRKRKRTARPASTAVTSTAADAEAAPTSKPTSATDAGTEPAAKKRRPRTKRSPTTAPTQPTASAPASE